MCHVSRNNTTLTTPASVEATPVIGSIRGSKSTPSRISPFRRIAKTAKVNLNKYWGLLSQKQKSSSASKESSVMEFDHAAEMEQNQINEMLEALANAEEQNSINSQIESEFSSPQQPRRMFVRQRALLSSTSYSSCNSFTSHASSAYHMDCSDSIASQESLYY